MHLQNHGVTYVRVSRAPIAELEAYKKRMRKLGLIAVTLAATVAAASAADYPDRPIRFIVPQAAGSATDTVARILAAELTKELGQQVIVDDRPGGALTIGLDLVAKSPPDGYTIGMGPIGALAITRHMSAVSSVSTPGVLVTVMPR